MKRKLTFLALLLIILFVAASTGYARLNGYSLPWWTNDAGGGDSHSEKYQLSGTIGQADAQTLSGSNYRLEGGFWGGPGFTAQYRRVYLPLTARP